MSKAVVAAHTDSHNPLGILGGTFDPVHNAHLQLAKDARQQLGLEKILWIPAGNPPHRLPTVATAEQRLTMVELAIRSSDNSDFFVVDDSEIRSNEPSYTVATLQRLRTEHGNRPLVLLLGADAFLGLACWYRWQTLFDLAHIAVATRPGYVLKPEAMDSELRTSYWQRLCEDLSQIRREPAGSIVTYPIKPLDISASMIRNKLAADEKTKDLLPPVVLDYIANNHLYTAH